MKKMIFTIIVLIVSVSAFMYYLNSPPGNMQEPSFAVHHGESITMIAGNLEKQGLIKNKNFFVYLSYALKRRYIPSGNYQFTQDNTTVDILIKLTRGEFISKKIVIPEGFNMYQIADRLEANKICTAAGFLSSAADSEFLKSVRIDSPSAEGYLFPDTYVFPEGTNPRDIIAVMRRKMERVMGDFTRKRSNRSSHEILTLASLIEREAKIPTERGLISSVFHNRLMKRMKLDCDPTVRYATKKFTGPITVSELNTDSPYNTYKVTGLPPTPICSPGRGSIVAAVEPDTTDYLYFVAKKDGTHHFSKTLKEHMNAVRQFRR